MSLIADQTGVRAAADPDLDSGLDSATPYLELDPTIAVGRFAAMAELFGPRAVHYAVKANPHPVLLAQLWQAGCRFDVASPGELMLALSAGADPTSLVYSNPVKRRSDLAFAHRHGVRLFVADCAEEIAKQAEAAPGSAVLVRLATSGAGSDWPLSVKFGCSPDQIVPLLSDAADRGLDAAGIAFHVGSQQRDPGRWDGPIAEAARAFAALRRCGLRPRLLDIGGGFPAAHEGETPALAAYAASIHGRIQSEFGEDRPLVLLEPGRGIAGDAGTLVSEVLSVCWRGGRRWVYVDVGVYTGLVETLGESIRYRLRTDHSPADGLVPNGPAVLAGPTCDSVDVLYAETPVMLPLGLREGDRVIFESAGAYTASYSTVGFNGFAPLPTHIRPARPGRS